MTGSLAFKLLFSTSQLGFSPTQPICWPADVLAFSTVERMRGLQFVSKFLQNTRGLNILF